MSDSQMNHTTLRHGLIALLVSLLCCGSSLADTTLTFASNGDSLPQTIAIGSGKIRIDSSDDSNWMMYDLQQDAMFMVDAAQQQYYRIDQAQIEQLTQQNSDLTRQLQHAKSGAPPGITPSLEPGTLLPAEASIVSAFEELKDRHAQSLEASEAAQRQAGCSPQILLDGKSTETYAQIVRKFTAKYTSFDIVRSDSLITPYQAEFKIPFQEEIRTGNSEAACNSAQFQQQPTTTVHHEFGSFYGYWIIQYEYRNGQWRVKSTVIEKNRDLYESAFQTGSPDAAKFLLNTNLYPELKNE